MVEHSSRKVLGSTPDTGTRISFFRVCLCHSLKNTSFSKRNEKVGKTFISKLNNFTGFKHIFIVLWQTRQIKSLFNLKDKNTHRSHVVYKGDCSCGVDYIGETRRNVEVRIDEHSNPSNDSEPVPVTYRRIRPILLVGEYFVRPNLSTSVESLKA